MMYQKINNDFNFKLLGQFDITQFQKGLMLLTDFDWNEYSFRQNTFNAHRQTQTIPLLYDEGFSNFPQKWKHYDKFEGAIIDLEKFFFNFYKRGRIVRCIIVKLLKKSIIREHTDEAESLIVSHRHHIPIITNNLVTFIVNKEKKNLLAGEVWEINNFHRHSVENASDTDRIHVIIDWNTNLNE